MTISPLPGSSEIATSVNPSTPVISVTPETPTDAQVLQNVLNDVIAPRWLRELHRFLPVKSQFVLTGAVRDRVAYPMGSDAYDMRSVAETLIDTMALRGIKHVVTVDPIHGLTVGVPMDADSSAAKASAQWFTALCQQSEQLTFAPDHVGRLRAPITFGLAVEFAERAITNAQTPCAVIFDYMMGGGERGGKENAPFIRSLIASHEARSRNGLFNPIIWIVDRENDLPAWFTLGNPRIRTITVGKPDRLVRTKVAASLLSVVPGFDVLEPDRRELAVGDFAQQTDGMALGDLEAIAALCRAEQLPPAEIGEATRRYKLGITEDVWQRMGESTLKAAEAKIRERVRGQDAATAKALDIVRRAVVGLSGAQAARNSGRPRGVLFFAGPTGVGKTELAKALTEGLFGDERAYIRFDMSEFNHEHSDQRLVGAPPGYVGYDAGGELTEAIRQKPCAIVLFDEIEKAHGRILDKFLQILDDGQLTSGAGERVWFTDALIIFTSNIGMAGAAANLPREALEERIRAGVDDYFKRELKRPELLNRIGDNIVVFDYIREDVAVGIFDKMLENILEKIFEVRAVRVTLLPPALVALRERCIHDLANGGRGIGNMLESFLINPLSNAILEHECRPGMYLTIEEFAITAGIPKLTTRVSTP